MFVSESLSWNEIITFYQKLNDVYDWNMQPMVQLVEAIASSQYSDGIFGITSHDTLCISQSKQINFERNLLTIEFIEGRFIFKYREWTYSKIQWVKESDAQGSFATFEHIMKRLKWFLN